MKQLTDLAIWKSLAAQAEQTRLQRITDLTRHHSPKLPMRLQQQGIQIDFSQQLINPAILADLLTLAEKVHLPEKIQALFSGQKVNAIEQRPALHSALRTMSTAPLMVDGCDVIPEILNVRAQMRVIADTIRAGDWLGYSGQAITDIVNIGIGGSDLGPRFCVDALAAFAAPHLRTHFVSDVDPDAVHNVVKFLDPATTLFIVASKSFTTRETMLNATKAKQWFGQAATAQHFIAVTANVSRAKQLGFQHVLPIWEWVGGRFSLCSAINLITAIAIGFDAFEELLRGAHDMDQHCLEAPLSTNLPVLLALLGIWNVNFLHKPTLLVLVYARSLEKWVPFVQQLEMESLGKSIDIQGRSVNYATGPMIWGGMGNQVQHSYLQLLCQSNHKASADFISLNTFDTELVNDLCRATMRVLSQGIHHHAQGYVPGGMPLTHIQLQRCDPYHLGGLVALYEHKVYVQSVIWHINAFDQPSIEQAKQVLFAKQVLLAADQ